MKKLLVVVDYQNDFVNGALGFVGAEKLDEKIVKKIKLRRSEGWDILFTYDTHGEDYLSTQEGRKLPVVHCIKDTEGWQLFGETAKQLMDGDKVIYKPTFGSLELVEHAIKENYSEVEIVGLVSDICVMTNAALLKTALPDAEVTVDAECTSCFDPEKNKAALSIMESIQVNVVNK